MNDDQYKELINSISVNEFGRIIEEMSSSYNEETKPKLPDFEKMILKCENRSNNPSPSYAKDGDSGFDLRAFLDKPVTLKPFERKLIPTGLYFELPVGAELQIRPRSGLSLKNGITVLNSPGTVDYGYRNEICVILINLSQEDFIVNNGDRIAQAVLVPVFGENLTDIIIVDKVSTETDRSLSGFGSSGIK